VVVRGPAVGDLHPGGVSVPRGPRGGALQAAEGGTPHGEALGLPPGAVSPHRHGDWDDDDDDDDDDDGYFPSGT